MCPLIYVGAGRGITTHPVNKPRLGSPCLKYLSGGGVLSYFEGPKWQPMYIVSSVGDGNLALVIM